MEFVYLHEVSIKLAGFCNVTSCRLVVTYENLVETFKNFCAEYGGSVFFRKFSEPTYTPN